MKVAVLVPGGLDPSGTHRVIPALLALIERLARAADVHAFAFAPATNQRYELCGAHVRTPDRGARAVRVMHALRAEHARGNFDVLHAFWAVPCGTVAVALKHVLRVPAIVHLAGGELAALPAIGYGGARSRRGRALVRAVLRGADVVTAPSQPVIDAAARFGVRARRLALGVDRSAWPPSPPRVRDPGRPARLVHVASLNPVKDPFTLIQALAHLAARHVPFTLDVIGEDTLDGAVEARAHDHGLTGRIRFHGFRTQSELRPIVRASHLMVMASLHEAGPIAALEAALCGVPVAGTRVGHLAEWEPEAAAVAPPGDAVALGAAIQRMLCDEDLRLRVAGRAQLRALEDDADATARRTLELYHELTGR